MVHFLPFIFRVDSALWHSWKNAAYGHTSLGHWASSTRMCKRNEGVDDPG